MTDNHGIAGTAHDLVYGARAKTYGHPKIDFSIIAMIWSGLLQDKLKDGEVLDPHRVAVLMTGLKLARLVQSPQHTDSRIDTIGYMLTMERLDEVEDDGTTQDHDPDCSFHPTVADLKASINRLEDRPGDDAGDYGDPEESVTLKPTKPYKQPLPLQEQAEREIDKLLGRETAEHSMQLDAEQEKNPNVTE